MTTLVTRQLMQDPDNRGVRDMVSMVSNHLKAFLAGEGDLSSSSILMTLEEDLVVGSLSLINIGLI